MRSTIGVAIAVVAIVAIVAIAGDWTSVGCRYFHGPPVASWRPLFFGAAILHGGGPEFFETAGRNANLSTELDGLRPSAPSPISPKLAALIRGCHRPYGGPTSIHNPVSVSSSPLAAMPRNERSYGAGSAGVALSPSACTP
jgi:hypothetical protein